MTCPKCRRAMLTILVCYDDGTGVDYDGMQCVYCLHEIEVPDRQTRQIEALFRKVTEDYTSPKPYGLKAGRSRKYSRRGTARTGIVRETSAQLV